jgi:rRNA maturation RNase YbeY
MSMNVNERPLAIFIFTGCSSQLCRQARSVLLRYLSRCGEVISSIVPLLRGQEINLVISEGRTIRGMNLKFRGVDAATDVLSFPLGDDVVGEVWVCPAVIERNAKRFNQSFENELLRVCIHGILHLGGFDHKKAFSGKGTVSEEMFVLQEKVHAAVISSVA